MKEKGKSKNSKTKNRCAPSWGKQGELKKQEEGTYGFWKETRSPVRWGEGTKEKLLDKA